ncbi:hypothetical protein ES703_73624 [subsurface metagenome]
MVLGGNPKAHRERTALPIPRATKIGDAVRKRPRVRAIPIHRITPEAMIKSP